MSRFRFSNPVKQWQHSSVQRNRFVSMLTNFRAFARMGTSYMKENNYSSAVEYFNKSLTEHRTKDVLEKLQKCQKAIAEAERLAYINPDIALEEKQKGNDLYGAGEQ